MPFTKLCHRNNSKGNRVYFVRYYITGNRGNERKITIGNVSSRRAKEISERIRAMVIQGVDPQEFYKEQAETYSENTPLKLVEITEDYLQHCSIINSANTIALKNIHFNLFSDNYFSVSTTIKIELNRFRGIHIPTANLTSSFIPHPKFSSTNNFQLPL